MPENKFYKYSLKLRWPAICRNRSVETLQERPDLADQMNRYREKVSNFCLTGTSILSSTSL